MSIMAGKGPAPKPANLRQRRNKKPGAVTLTMPPPEETNQGEEAPLPAQKVPALPNPDKRKWHPLTRGWWKRVWESPMADQYLPTDVDGLARVALLIDDFNKKPDGKLLGEIRLQEARFGLSPADRSRLQWEIQRAPDPNRKPQPRSVERPEPHYADPRGILGVVK